MEGHGDPVEEGVVTQVETTIETSLVTHQLTMNAFQNHNGRGGWQLCHDSSCADGRFKECCEVPIPTVNEALKEVK
ncbi:oligoribonuclease, partial [Sesbania bispinosa]